MQRLLIPLGIVLIVAGVLGMGLGIIGPVRLALTTAVNGPDAAKYCRPGEKLVERRGDSRYRPGQGYARDVSYACVDAAGTSRDVTAEVGKDLVDDSLSSVGTAVLVSVITAGAILVGSLMLMAGIVLALMRRAAAARVRSAR